MRADAHYVDALMSHSRAGSDQLVAINAIEPPGEINDESIEALVTSVRRHGVLQPIIVQKRKGRHRLIAGRRRLAAAIEAGLREIPCVVHEVGHEEAKALAEAANLRAAETSAAAPLVNTDASGALLEQSLATLMACSTALASVSSTLARGGVTELIRAEAWRAASLALAGRLMRQELFAARTSLSLARFLDGVVDSFGPEFRVRNVDVEVEATPRGGHVAMDAQIAGAWLAQALFATLAVLDGTTGARLRIAAALSDTGELTLSVGQGNVGVAASWASRVFDESWSARPGGEAALVWALAMNASAEAVGGRCQFSGNNRSTRIALVLADVGAS